MAKVKMTRDTVPEGFTLKLALVDAIPVLFFGASMIAVSVLFKSPMFLFGALLCLFAGAAKVIWKIIVVLKKKNIWWLFMQMRIVMPVGFLLMLLSVIFNLKTIKLSAILSAVVSMPSVVFFAIGIVGMVLMGIFASKLDSSDVRSNWIEQITNAFAQGSIFVGILFLIF